MPHGPVWDQESPEDYDTYEDICICGRPETKCKCDDEHDRVD